MDEVGRSRGQRRFRTENTQRHKDGEGPYVATSHTKAAMEDE